jgi:hypothetical protein
MMISVIQHIEYLMMYHDCVVVPGWGALIANYTSSTHEGNNVLRPQRSIGFNATINHNDGLLANSLMRRHQLRYEQACSLISDNVTTFFRHLSSGNELAFGHLGYFRLADKQRLEFVPMPSGYSCDEYFGLNDFSVTASAQHDDTQEQLFTPVAVTWKERIKVAASIAAIVGMGLLLSTPVIIDKATQTASLNVTEVKSQPTRPTIAHSQVSVKPNSKATDNDKQFAVIDDNGKATSVRITNLGKEEPEKDEAIYDEGMPSKGIYCLVINSCSTAKKAAMMSRQYTKKGIKNQVVKRGNYHHIVVAQSDSQKELIKIKKTLLSKYKHAWVCK